MNKEFKRNLSVLDNDKIPLPASCYPPFLSHLYSINRALRPRTGSEFFVFIRVINGVDPASFTGQRNFEARDGYRFYNRKGKAEPIKEEQSEKTL